MCDSSKKCTRYGAFFIKTGCGGWISLARHKVPAVRKFVVIRTSHGLFSYTNFEPATALRWFKPINHTIQCLTKNTPIGAFFIKSWLRGLDLNQRPSGYEPDELPGCSTPR